MKQILVLLALTFSFNIVYSQLKVESDGSLQVNSYAGNWGRANYTIVHNPYTCAYHLRYNNEDRFYVCAEGWTWTKKGGYMGSDLKLKKNIGEINSPLSTILKLNGIQFDYKDEETDLSFSNNSNISNGQRLGFIAQEVEQVLPGIVKTMNDNVKAISYTDIIALLVESMKEQQQMIRNLQDQLDELNKKVSFGNIGNTNIQDNFSESNEPAIFQNNPNPFNQTTKISYFLPANVVLANIYIYDLNGKQLKNFELKNRGNGAIAINGSDLKAGMYHYSLIVNGQIIDTKKMILTN